MLKWLGREGLQLIQTLNNDEKDKCKISTVQLKMLKKSKPHHTEMILPLQYCKLVQQQGENAQE